MFSSSRKGWAGLAALALFLTLLSLQSFTTTDCECTPPSNGTVTAQTDSSASFSWDVVSGATAYQVWYVRQADSYTGPVSTVSAAAVTFNGLSAGRYVFYLATECGVEVSDFVVLEDLILE